MSDVRDVDDDKLYERESIFLVENLDLLKSPTKFENFDQFEVATIEAPCSITKKIILFFCGFLLHIFSLFFTVLKNTSFQESLMMIYGTIL